VAREYGFIGSIPYRLELRFQADTPRLDCKVTFHFDGEKIGRLSDDVRDGRSPFIHEQKLRFKLFPGLGQDCVGVRDLPFAISETTNRYVEGLYWTALADGQRGVAFFNRGTMGAVREEDGGFSLPLAYAMHYIWGTRMLEGDFNYEFAIEPFTGGWRAADLHRLALAYNFPVVVTTDRPGSGTFGEALQPLSTGAENVLVSALYPEDGQAWLRLFEFRGQPGETSITLQNAEASLRATDLLGRSAEAPSNPIALAPWQFRTFQLRPQH
jgi:hypothetical protein